MQSAAIEEQPCEAISPPNYFGTEATVKRIAEWMGTATGR